MPCIPSGTIISCISHVLLIDWEPGNDSMNTPSSGMERRHKIIIKVNYCRLLALLSTKVCISDPLYDHSPVLKLSGRFKNGLGLNRSPTYALTPVRGNRSTSTGTPGPVLLCQTINNDSLPPSAVVCAGGTVLQGHCHSPCCIQAQFAQASESTHYKCMHRYCMFSLGKQFEYH